MNANGDFTNMQYYFSGALRPVINILSTHYLEPVSNGVYRMIGGGK
jgi:hypothetical protein